jgi:predicted alpha/beta-fold hydrolase
VKISANIDFSAISKHIYLMNNDFILETADKEKLGITVYGIDGSFAGKPCLIYVHGFKGFKDWGFIPFAAEYFAERGFLVITFNFSHNGINGNKLVFTELDKFANNTFSREISELKEVIGA